MSQRKRIQESVERTINWRKSLEKKIKEHQAAEKASRPKQETTEEK